MARLAHGATPFFHIELFLSEVFTFSFVSLAVRGNHLLCGNEGVFLPVAALARHFTRHEVPLGAKSSLACII